MRSVEYDRFGPADVTAIRERPVPQPGPREVLVRVRAAALNPKDVLVRKGKFALLSGRGFPRQMGYDFAGEVEAAGHSVRGVAKGAAVFGMLNRWRAGALADHCVVPEAELYPKPPSLSWEEAAALPLTSLTALQAVRDRARLRVGQRVLIHGASGGVGVAAIQVAKALGAHVTAVCSAGNRALVESLGCDAWLDYRTGDVFAATATGAAPYDVVFDVFGNQTLDRVRPVLAAHGRYVSTVPGPRVFWDALRTSIREQRALLVVVRSRAQDLAQLASWVQEGKLRAVVHGVYTLEQAVEAQRQLESKHTRGKVVVRLD
ncbi:MAG TPA: NAD(P)-dependent alcohol dehydrogenase [Polyangiales bacterium]